MSTPQGSKVVHGSLTVNRLLIWIAAVLMFCAGLTELGANVFGVGVPALGWAFFSLTAWLLSMVL